MKCRVHTNGQFIKRQHGYSLFCDKGIEEMQQKENNGTVCQMNVKEVKQNEYISRQL